MHGDFSQRRRANQKIRSLAVGSVSGLCKRGGEFTFLQVMRVVVN